MIQRDVVITGIGLASSLGEGVGLHAQALAAGAAPVVDTASFRALSGASAEAARTRPADPEEIRPPGQQISDGKFGHRGGRSHARPYRTHDVTVVKSRHRYIPNPTPPSITRLCAVTPPASGLAR